VEDHSVGRIAASKGTMNGYPDTGSGEQESEGRAGGRSQMYQVPRIGNAKVIGAYKNASRRIAIYPKWNV
jgi:hypothetical protein